MSERRNFEGRNIFGDVHELFSFWAKEVEGRLLGTSSRRCVPWQEPRRERERKTFSVMADPECGSVLGQTVSSAQKNDGNGARMAPPPNWLRVYEIKDRLNCACQYTRSGDLERGGNKQEPAPEGNVSADL